MSSTTNTITKAFQDTVARHGAKTALRYKEAKAYKDVSYTELARRVEEMASGLAALGIEKGDRVAILSENRPEWVVTDLAVLALGGVVVPIYPTLPAAQIAYIVRNSGAKALVVSDAKQLKKGIEARTDLPDLLYLIAMDPGPVSEEANVHTYASVIELGARQPLGADAYAARREAVAPEDVASIVYTSGTTGDPKGAMLTHGNFMWDVDAALEHFRKQDQPVGEADTFLSFLPVCHVFERTTGYYLPLRVGATIGYSEGVRTLVDDMAAVQPTLMVCVPRVYEAMQERIEDTVAKAPEKRQKVFRQALGLGADVAERRREGKGVGPLDAIKHLVFEKMVYAKLRERFGGKLRFFVSGGAALNVETARFFEAIGIPIIEGYGMTEASPVMAANPNKRIKLGTVGTVVPGGELKIAPDGEILYRGPNIMKGYWKNDTATGEMIDGEGWLHTGDVGVIDDEGYLKITDRKKDILVLANGKNVAPQPIEAKIKQSPFITEIVLIGDKQSVITALVVPNKSKLGDWAKSQNLAFADDDALLALPDVRKKIKQEIDAQSKDLADFEKIKKFALLNATFSVDTGEMTPTLKVKRKVVLQKYAREVASLRGEEAEAAVAA
jgi:long-chain acyl-CoA synthetase